MNKFVSKSENDTIEFANSLASLLKNGDIIVLSGDLGSGKTKFTQGILKHFGLENEISSPTFTIVNEYHKDEINIYHFDVYRLSDSDEFYAIGGDEYLNNGICIIEWGEIIEDVLPNDYIKINFTKDAENENYRTLELIANGTNSQNILNQL
ncbi:MAG: tRNA (adenosine(37)-N6)-threonylcarbamoyltransferase complex ATPase subunit type 1 TsaE [Clostridia bacterium]|nr:tRNA (adenosine(37)-N6)-threonylcarbamoyltransferase complex ATPase subunit type 1 TsaE [Clostridia bacterium]